MRWATFMIRCAVSSSRSVKWSTWAFGMTKHSPGAVGRIAMKAMTRSSWQMMLAGARPATISQKMQLTEASPKSDGGCLTDRA